MVKRSQSVPDDTPGIGPLNVLRKIVLGDLARSAPATAVLGKWASTLLLGTSLGLFGTTLLSSAPFAVGALPMSLFFAWLGARSYVLFSALEEKWSRRRRASAESEAPQVGSAKRVPLRNRGDRKKIRARLKASMGRRANSRRADRRK